MAKLLYVITGLGLGGAEKVVCNLADQMTIYGHEVTIAFLTGEVIVRPKNQKIKIISLGLNSVGQIFIASKKYRQLIQDFQPDVVHAHMVHANIFARLNRIGCNISKLICTAHNSDEGGKLRMFAYKTTNFLSDLNTNVSQEATEALIKKGAFNSKNLITIYNGVDLNRFNFMDVSKDVTEIIFLAVGRFNEQKDYPNLFYAVNQLKNKIDQNIKIYIAGDGDLRPKLEQLILDLEISNYVTLLGKRSDIPQLLNKADFFILSSKHEGLPTVVIEAMACGTFVISTDCGGSAEIMGDTGILVPPQNSEALAEGMQKALSYSVEEINMNRQKARQRIEERFSLESSVQTWLALYEKH